MEAAQSPMQRRLSKKMSEPRMTQIIQSIQQAPQMANTTPLGLLTFAITCMTFSCHQCGLFVDVHASSSGTVLGLTLMVGGVVELIAGILLLLQNQNLAGTIFCAFGGLWLSYSALFVSAFNFLGGYSGPDAVEDITNGLGIYLLSYCIFTLCMTIAAHKTNVVLVAILACVTSALFCWSVAYFVGGGDQGLSEQGWRTAGGVIGIIGAILAFYLPFAVLVAGDINLPVGDLSGASAAPAPKALANEGETA